VPSKFASLAVRRRAKRTVDLMIPTMGWEHSSSVTRAEQRVEGKMAAAYANPQRQSLDIGVDASDLELFDERLGEVRAAMGTWDSRRVRESWQALVEPANLSATWPATDIFSSLSVKVKDLVKYLDTKARSLLPVLKKGNLSVDNTARRISTKTLVLFREVQEPDSSAQLEPGQLAAAKEIIQDVIGVLQEYLQPMVVEIQVAGDEPYPYFLDVAMNRANVIVDMLHDSGVPRGLLHAGAAPGGGQALVIYPFDREEQETKRLEHRQRRRPKPVETGDPKDAKGKKGSKK